MKLLTKNESSLADFMFSHVRSSTSSLSEADPSPPSIASRRHANHGRNIQRQRGWNDCGSWYFIDCIDLSWQLDVVLKSICP